MSLPKTMKAMVLTAHGGMDCLAWREDMPVPQPRPDEVLVQVGAAAGLPAGPNGTVDLRSSLLYLGNASLYGSLVVEENEIL
ncbi:MAG: hypothetical protein VX181_17815, partial [Pseudomonadota bacterium]|nr:hypothetical protein [Pseudomonadota bacterium]